jgi:hypothetical protein
MTLLLPFVSQNFLSQLIYFSLTVQHLRILSQNKKSSELLKLEQVKKMRPRLPNLSNHQPCSCPSYDPLSQVNPPGAWPGGALHVATRDNFFLFFSSRHIRVF